MKKIVSVALVWLLVLSGFIGLLNFTSEQAEGQLADSPWPMFRGGTKHTGRSPYDTSHLDGTEIWNFSTDENGYSSPAIGSDGTIYVGSGDDNLYAVKPDGTQRWNLTTCSAISSTPAVDSDGTIYVASENLYAVNPDGTKNWNFSTPGYMYSSPAIGSDGTIYVGSYDNNLYAVNPDGTEKWNFSTNSHIYSSPAIGSDGTIYVGSYDNNLYAVNPDGTEKWNFSTGGYLYSSPAIGGDKTVYIGSADANLYAINLDGTEKWSFSVDSHVSSSPAIGSDGTIYFGSKDSNMYAVKPNGTEKWSFSTENSVSSSPAIGSDGTIYIGSNDHNLYAVNPDGTEKWSFSTGDAVHSSPAIGSDGTIYVGSNKLFKIGGNDTAPPSVWIDSPTEHTVTSNSSVLLEWSGSDNESGINHYEVQIDSGGWTGVGANTSHTFSGLSDGSYSVDVKAVDNTGNTKTDTVNFTVDTTSPTIWINDPSEHAVNNNTDITVLWNGSDDTTSIDHYEVKIDDRNWINKGFNKTHLFSNLSDGNHDVVVRAYDTVGNTAEDNVSFLVDTTAPSLTIISPFRGANISSSSIKVEWNGSDDTGIGIDYFEVQLDSGGWTGVGDDTNHTFTALSDDIYSVEIKAVDKAGNADVDDIRFTVDTISPSVSITSLSEGKIITGTSITVKWTGSDDHSAIQRYLVRTDNGGWMDVETNTSYTWKDLSAGEHTITVKAVDMAGNENTTTVEFEVEESSTALDAAADHWWAIVLLVIAVIIIIGALYYRERKWKEEPVQEEEPQDRSGVEDTTNAELDEEKDQIEEG